jgi:phosphoribosylanthranilate isomerase
VWVKICGLSDADNLEVAIEAGADAVGFVFAPRSPRFVEAATVRALIDRVPAGVETVGVFRNQDLTDVIRLATQSGVSTVQLHGDEPPSDHSELRERGWRTVRATTASNWLSDLRRADYREDLLLIDAPEPGAGETFDASGLLQDPPTRDWILAGGLRPSNVADLVTTLSPWGVDVSSGIETAPGQKSPVLIREFIAAARAARVPERG